ncbi:MAG TPA: hypothetical protein VFY45_16740 [Baekduia sp.]|nr:hypothetical protein [Baekduia sp.]
MQVGHVALPHEPRAVDGRLGLAGGDRAVRGARRRELTDDVPDPGGVARLHRDDPGGVGQRVGGQARGRPVVRGKPEILELDRRPREALGIGVGVAEVEARGLRRAGPQGLADVVGVGALVPADDARELEQLTDERAAVERIGIEGRLEILDEQAEAQDGGILLGRRGGVRRARPRGGRRGPAATAAPPRTSEPRVRRRSATKRPAGRSGGRDAAQAHGAPVAAAVNGLPPLRDEVADELRIGVV